MQSKIKSDLPLQFTKQDKEAARQHARHLRRFGKHHSELNKEKPEDYLADSPNFVYRNGDVMLSTSKIGKHRKQVCRSVSESVPVVNVAVVRKGKVTKVKVVLGDRGSYPPEILAHVEREIEEGNKRVQEKAQAEGAQPARKSSFAL